MMMSVETGKRKTEEMEVGVFARDEPYLPRQRIYLQRPKSGC